VHAQERGAIKKLCGEWHTRADTKYQEQKHRSDPSAFSDSKDVLEPFQLYLDRTWKFDCGVELKDRMIVCHKEDKTVLGIAAFSLYPEKVELELLAVHPDHLFHTSNYETREKGIGRQMIEFVVREFCVPIVLSAYEAAVPFYERIGFEVLPAEGGLTTLELGAEKVAKLARASFARELERPKKASS